VVILKNEKHERFCQEFLIDLNRKQAYIRAGYRPKEAESSASRLYANARIRARIDELMAERSKRTGVTQDRVIRELARISFLDPTRIINLNHATILEGATEDDRAAIASVKVKEGEDFTEREIRFYDKTKTLEQLGRHLGMFKDGLSITVDLPKIVDDLGAGLDA
jgi:phage terminase small subunit